MERDVDGKYIFALTTKNVDVMSLCAANVVGIPKSQNAD